MTPVFRILAAEMPSAGLAATSSKNFPNIEKIHIIIVQTTIFSG
jgi:hypothetical protein